MNAVYRCDRKCPVYKRCFICKSDRRIPDDVTFVVYCPHLKTNIPVVARDALVKQRDKTSKA